MRRATDATVGDNAVRGQAAILAKARTTPANMRESKDTGVEYTCRHEHSNQHSSGCSDQQEVPLSYRFRKSFPIGSLPGSGLAPQTITGPFLLSVSVFMAAMRSRCEHYILQLWFLSFFFFFPRLFAAVGDKMSTILPHMMWPKCEFRMHV